MSKDELIKVEEISEAEVLAAIYAARPGSDTVEGAISTRDLASILNTTQEQAQSIARKLNAAGSLIFAGKRRGLRMDNVPCLTPVYRIVKQS